MDKLKKTNDLSSIKTGFPGWRFKAGFLKMLKQERQSPSNALSVA